MRYRSDLLLYVNGKRIVVRNPDPEMFLQQYLRHQLGLTGTKLGCAQGGCGACTVMISRFDHVTQTISNRAVNACLIPLCSLHACAVTTIEGVGSTNNRLHVVQEIVAKSHASQCGFCTPGFVMSMYALLRNHPLPTMEQVEEALVGNLCRCTGYRPLIEGFRQLTVEGQLESGRRAENVPDDVVLNGEDENGLVDITDSISERFKLENERFSYEGIRANLRSDHNETLPIISGYFEHNIHALGETGKTCTDEILKSKNGCSVQEKCCMGEKCCMRSQCETKKVSTFEASYDPSKQEAIFPSELQLNAKQHATECLLFRTEKVSWFRPCTLPELLRLKARHPTAYLVAGYTELGTLRRVRDTQQAKLIDVNNIQEFRDRTVKKNGVEIGSVITLSELNDFLKEITNQITESKTNNFRPITEMISLIGSQQIRNVATLGGHIMTAGPVSDLNPLLQVAGCSVRVISSDGTERVETMDEDFFTGYKATRISSKDLLKSIFIPFTGENEYMFGIKQARKKSDDNGNVTSGLKVKFKENDIMVEDIAISFSGMGSHTKMAVETANKLKGKNWNEDLVSLACRGLTEELQLESGDPGGKLEFRMVMIVSMFFKFYLRLRFMLQEKLPHLYANELPETYRSAISLIENKSQSERVRVFEQLDASQEVPNEPVGQSVPHLSAKFHATGEATYTNDIPSYQNELCLALVTSTKSFAEIVSVDTTEAVRMKGVVDYIDCRDVPGNNVKDTESYEEIFRSQKVTSEGQAIGAIIADTQVNARRAAKAVKVQYKELESITSIEQAIVANSYIEMSERKISCGNVENGMSQSDHAIEGEFRVGGQKHFYMETQCCIVIPKCENNEIEVLASTQSLSTIQTHVARALNLDFNKIACHVKRIGGGFGGKETSPLLVALPAAVAAHKHKRAVRCVLDRDEDMVMCGGRHPFLVKYKVGFTKEGRLMAVHLELFSNGGYSTDLSVAVLENALTFLDNCYYIPNLYAAGRVCRTNLPSNTAFRGFGGPQAMIICEHILNEIALTIGEHPNKIRELNMYKEGDRTPYNQILSDCPIERCWSEVMKMSDYENRRTEVFQFNQNNAWKKRGLSVIPIKYAVGTATHFDQAGAHVNIYTDGSVLLAHGGMEMGQGLHTKMIQIASRVLQIPMSKIFIRESDLSVVPNPSPTSASRSSDLNGMAVLKACQTLVERLKPYREANPSGTWDDWVLSAYLDKVSLTATGFHKLAGLDYSYDTNTGQRFAYFTPGAACTEVEIDCLTGEHKILRTDIVMDVGRSLNPAIDIGQIEGAFVQGYGLYVLENLQYSPDGLLYNRGPNTYRLPTLLDIPKQFNVSLLKDSSNPKAVYSSKGIGEPPLMLAMTVFFAIRDAVESARQQRGLSLHFPFDSPATAERIRLALRSADKEFEFLE